MSKGHQTVCWDGGRGGQSYGDRAAWNVQHLGGPEGEAKLITTGSLGNGQICFRKYCPPQPKKAAMWRGPLEGQEVGGGGQGRLHRVSVLQGVEGR